jgi:hypothetical protein
VAIRLESGAGNSNVTPNNTARCSREDKASAVSKRLVGLLLYVSIVIGNGMLLATDKAV